MDHSLRKAKRFKVITKFVFKRNESSLSSFAYFFPSSLLSLLFPIPNFPSNLAPVPPPLVLGVIGAEVGVEFVRELPLLEFAMSHGRRAGARGFEALGFGKAPEGAGIDFGGILGLG